MTAKKASAMPPRPGAVLAYPGYPGMPAPGYMPYPAGFPGYPPGYPGYPRPVPQKEKKDKAKDKGDRRKNRKRSRSSTSSRSRSRDRSRSRGSSSRSVSRSSSGSSRKRKKKKKKKHKDKKNKKNVAEDLDSAARAQEALRAAAAAAAVAGARKSSPDKQTPRQRTGWEPEEDLETEFANRSRNLTSPENIEILKLPKSVIGRVIGKAGATIKEIRERTGARIDARDQTEDPVQVLLSGTTEACEHARALILEVADGAAIAEGDASRDAGRAAAAAAAVQASAAVQKSEVNQESQKQPMVEEHLELPRHATGKVIGAKGAQIAEIRSKSGAQVDVDKSPSGCRVRIVGTQDQVEVAKAMINAVVAPMPDDGHGDYLEIPRSAVGRIIGAGGSRISDMQERSGAKIDIDRQPDRVLVRFSGFPENVATAKMLVSDVLEGRDRTLMAEAAATLEIPPTATGKLIGPGGRQINEIQEKSGAKVDLDKSRDPCIVRMTGSHDAVALAQVMIREVLGTPGSSGTAILSSSNKALQDASLTASVARAAAAAQAAKVAVALSGGKAPAAGGCAPGGIGGAHMSEESITFDIPLHLADKVLGDGSWQKSVEQKSGAKVLVRRDVSKCQLELIGLPEQIVEAESLAEETVRVIVAGSPMPAPPTLPPAVAPSPAPAALALEDANTDAQSTPSSHQVPPAQLTWMSQTARPKSLMLPPVQGGHMQMQAQPAGQGQTTPFLQVPAEQQLTMQTQPQMQVAYPIQAQILHHPAPLQPHLFDPNQAVQLQQQQLVHQELIGALPLPPPPPLPIGP